MSGQAVNHGQQEKKLEEGRWLILMDRLLDRIKNRPRDKFLGMSVREFLGLVS